MVVNSINFLLFFAVVFIVYYLPVCRNNSRLRNCWLFLASYFFYGVANWKMIPLLFGATIVFYFLGLWLKSEMVKNHSKRVSYITTLGVCLGIGVLLYFKYLNFFAASFAELLRAFGLKVSWTTLNIVLPIGVSFFTFKLISYVIEIHREHIEPSKDFIEFGTYIAFFPTILSGPIDKPNKFIPQLRGEKSFDFNLAVDGCQQILWGIFTKVVIADNLSQLTNDVWRDYSSCSSSQILIAILIAPIQLYADFDGYSNMAIGVGKLLGINITRNFKHPLLARNIAEYWRNWHMSLTGWLTEYVFSPLNIAFRNIGNTGIVLAIIINFILIGFWHGANWTYGLFGLYHGLLYVPLVYSGAFGKNKKLKESSIGLPYFRDFIRMASTYLLVSIGLVIFFSADLQSIVGIFHSLISNPWESKLYIGARTLLFVGILLICEWYMRHKEFPIQRESKDYTSHLIRLLIFDLIIAVVISLYGSSEQTTFIYFQF